MRLPAGAHMLYFFDVTEGYAYPEDQGKRVVEVSPSQQVVVGVDFVLTKDHEPPVVHESATVEGVVVDASGAPVAGAKISSDEQRKLGTIETSVRTPLGRSDAEGNFEFTIRAGVPHKISVGGGAVSSAQSGVFTPEPGTHYDLGAFVVHRLHGVFTGTVLDDTGAPLPNAEVYASSREISWTSDTVTTDSNGRFIMDPAPENDLMYVHIRKEGYGNGYSQSFRAVPSGEDRDYTLPREAQRDG